MKSWIVLPAFNEAENLPGLLDGIAAVLRPLGGAYTVVVVNDGSRDATAAVARAYARRLPVDLVSHANNRGLARTIETGIRVVLLRAEKGDVLITMDADNTHPPVLMPRMLSEIQNGADLVIASRFVPGGTEEGVALLRRILSHGLGVVMRLRFGMRGVRDYSCGYRAYHVELLRAAAALYGDRLIEARGFAVMAELLVKLASFSRRIVEVPLHLRYDLKRGGSKMRVARTVAEYFRLLRSRTPGVA